MAWVLTVLDRGPGTLRHHGGRSAAQGIVILEHRSAIEGDRWVWLGCGSCVGFVPPLMRVGVWNNSASVRGREEGEKSFHNWLKQASHLFPTF